MGKIIFPIQKIIIILEPSEVNILAVAIRLLNDCFQALVELLSCDVGELLKSVEHIIKILLIVPACVGCDYLVNVGKKVRSIGVDCLREADVVAIVTAVHFCKNVNDRVNLVGLPSEVCLTTISNFVLNC